MSDTNSDAARALGSIKTARKSESSRRNLEAARAKRWPTPIPTPEVEPEQRIEQTARRVMVPTDTQVKKGGE